MRNVIKRNDDFNERTNTVLNRIYLSHFILERGCFLCVRSKLETGTDCYILTPSSSDHSSTSFAFWLGCSTVGHWGPKPSLWSWFSLRWYPISNWNWNWLRPSVAPGYIIVLRYLLPVGVRNCHHHRIQPRPQVKVIFRYLRPDAPVSLFFRLFTLVHLLIDGSVEGQHVTQWVKCIFLKINCIG